MAERKNLTLPVGRLVQGNVYKGNTKDADGNDRIAKNGPNKGQVYAQWYMALAIQKGSERAWWETSWGQVIMNAGAEAFPNLYNTRADFAWKVKDGDSQVPDQNGNKPCEKEGFAGHWIVSLAGTFKPSTHRINQGSYETIPESEGEVIKCGYYVQIAATVGGNDSTQRPGVYINPGKVLLVGYGPEIVTGITAEEAFGNPAAVAAMQLPAGASAVPTGAQGMPAMPGVMPPTQPMVAPTTVAGPGMVAPAVPNAGVQPNPGFVQGPGVGTVPALPGQPTGVSPVASPTPIAVAPPTTISPSKTLTAAAIAANPGAKSVEDFYRAGWTNPQLIAQGYLVIQ